MGSKNQKHAGRPTESGASGLRQELERLIAKGHLKDAVKQAKLCFRAQGTPENHRLLERAYFLRADQLRRNAMPTAAQEVAQHLLDFGLTDPALVEEAVGLLLSLGMSREARKLQVRIDSPQVHERFARQEADLAVVHPERSGGAPAEVREGAQAIRAAIEAVQQGDEAKGVEALRDIARSSPFADWKLFVRGLAANSRGEEQEARANWDRLDPGRSAARIARALQALNGTSSAATGLEGAGAKATVKLDTLERRVFGAAVLEPLEQLRALLTEDRWDDAVRRIGGLRQILANIDPAFAVRLTRILLSPLILTASQSSYRGAKALVKVFTYSAERLPIDPLWNRLWALILEGPQGDIDQAEAYWRKYLKDLETVPCLEPGERALARALVLKRLGEQRADELEELADTSDRPFEAKPSERQIKVRRNEAIACFEESLRLAPDHLPTYRALLGVYEHWNRRDEAAAVARRLLEKFPDDFEAVKLLSHYHFQREEAEEALAYTRRARALKPLDQGAVGNEWSAHILRARDLALKERWDEGRAEFAEAERLRPETSQWLHVRARRAVFELKAGQAECASALIADALADLPEPTPLWLALLIEAIRYKLPKPDRELYEHRWQVGLAKKVRSETAGALAELMASFVGGEIDYPGRARHIQEVLGYLHRSTRIKYKHNDLANACSLLSLLPNQSALFEKLIGRGIKLFPKSPTFLMLAGSLELMKGPFGGGDPRLARMRFEKALELAEASSDPNDARLLPEIRENLSMLEDVASHPMGIPFAGFGGGPFSGGPGMGSFRDFLDALGDMYGNEPDEDEFGDDFDGEPPRLPSPRQTGAGRRTKPKNKEG